jgi:hypothetical protein
MRHPQQQRTRTRASRLAAAAAAAVAGACAVPLGGAGASGAELVPAGSGLTLPAGVAVTPDGAIWVADAELGVCRVHMDGARPSLVASDWCGPEPESGLGRRGPAATGQMAFDPASANFYVAENASGSTGVWRLRWDGTAIDGDPALSRKILNTGGDRVLGLALAADGSVDFTSRDSALVRRITAPASEARGLVNVGLAGAPGAPSLAHLGDAIYLAERDGVSRIAAPASGRLAEPVAGLEGRPNALAADHARERLYVGSAGTSGTDAVAVLSEPGGVVATYDTGYAHVTGLAVDADGDLLVADDPPTALGHPTPAGQSRLFRVALTATDRPVAAIVSGPPAAGSGRDVAFRFTARAGATFDCRLAPVGDIAGAAAGPCPGEPGQASYGGLADGTYAFETRATAGGGAGRWTRRTFTVDTAPPTVRIDDPAGRVVGDAASFDFSADETGVAYACSLDGAEPAPCAPPRRLRGLAAGAHEFGVIATDLAGNVSAPDAVAFTVERPPPAPAVPGEPGARAGGGAARPRQPAAHASSEECTGVRPPARPDTFVVRGRTLVVRLTAPAQARFAKVTLRSLDARWAGALKLGQGYLRRVAVSAVRPAAVPRVLRVRVSRADLRRLDAGRYLLASSYSTCRYRFGPWREIVVRRTSTGSPA